MLQCIDAARERRASARTASRRKLRRGAQRLAAAAGRADRAGPDRRRTPRRSQCIHSGPDAAAAEQAPSPVSRKGCRSLELWLGDRSRRARLPVSAEAGVRLAARSASRTAVACQPGRSGTNGADAARVNRSSVLARGLCGSCAQCARSAAAAFASPASAASFGARPSGRPANGPRLRLSNPRVTGRQ